MPSRDPRRSVVRSFVLMLAVAQLVLARDVTAQSAGTCPVSRDVRVAFPPSVADAAECGGEASNFTRPSSEIPDEQGEELHVIGVYEGSLPGGAARGFREHPEGTIEVSIHPTAKPVALVLSAYEPIRWVLSLEAGAKLSRIVTQGYHVQRVTGVPGDVPVTHLGADQVCSYAYGWEPRHDSGGGSILTMLASVRARTGLIERSFQGCYAGTAFDVPYLVGEPAPYEPPVLPGDETLPRDDVPFPSCRAVTAERDGYCVTTSNGGVELLGLTSGAMCPVTSIDSSSDPFHGASLAWRGQFLYVCGANGLVRTSLVDGASEPIGLGCQAVTDFDGGILLMPSIMDFASHGHRWYEGYESLVSDRVDATYGPAPVNSRMTSSGSVLLSAWHSTHVVDRVDLLTGEVLPPLELEGYDDWILGLATTRRGELVISSGTGVTVFDADTGRRLRDLAVPKSVTGLACADARSVARELQRRPVDRRRLATMRRLGPSGAR